MNHLRKWSVIFIPGLCWSTFALRYIFQLCWHLEMQCNSYICVCSFFPFASILRHAIHFPPNVSQVLLIIWWSDDDHTWCQRRISGTPINMLSKGVPILENDEARTWLLAKHHRIEILLAMMMKSRSFCLFQGCSCASQMLCGARLQHLLCQGTLERNMRHSILRPCSKIMFFGGEKK